MHFKMIIAIVQDDQTERILDVTRADGATGATIINNVRGEGLNEKKSFFGLSIDSQRDLILFIVEEHLSRIILESIESIILTKDGNVGVALQVDIEDVVGVAKQIDKLQNIIKDEI